MLVFLFKQKTAYEMRISDWSSDVCSSDLIRFKMRLAAWVVAVPSPMWQRRSGGLMRVNCARLVTFSTHGNTTCAGQQIVYAVEPSCNPSLFQGDRKSVV